MTDDVRCRVSPNPFSPYANADPDVRHLVPSLFGFGPTAGVLALTACERMAVVPDEPLRDATGRLGDLPPGLCPVCVSVATGEGAPGGGDPDVCRECGDGSSQGEWCALCRQDLHEQWWPTRNVNAALGTSEPAQPNQKETTK